MLRRGVLAAASAAVVCLGGVLAACAGAGPGGGYTAVGAGPAGPTAVTPSGPVLLVPLDGDKERGGPGDAPRGSGPARRTGTPPPSGEPRSTPPAPAPAGKGTPGTARPGGGPDGRTTPPAASPAPAPVPSRTTPPATPADLSWGGPVTEDADRRWCQKVTVTFHNSGGTAVRSGSVTFGTHIIGALGVDWGTVESTVELPVPGAPGAQWSPTWTVCVDAWRVPLGMHIETRDVSVEWG
ncbi:MULTISPECIES: hypothetical protein [Streptomyces]|uniref:hypothetical protein n=1 Tax=Streptomyces TaxID=1883 RepID=UPI000743EA8B